MKLVIIESPYAGDVARNMLYLKRCVLDCLARGESPYASHAFYTQFLDDTDPEQRTLGIEAGLAWAARADLAAVYYDYDISRGMELGLVRHRGNQTPITRRYIGQNP